ncbi:MAG TPA: hypothetical protein VNT75_22930 [Symbiobacteriaceae bacterium]|nr:hypothetical protein [Symbiobacteriaceae bacterium]
MRKVLVGLAALAALAAVLLLWPRAKVGLTPVKATAGDVTVELERYEIWTDAPPGRETPPPPWLQAVQEWLGTRTPARYSYSPHRERPAAAGTRSGWVRLTVAGPGIGPRREDVKLYLLTEDPPDRTPNSFGTSDLSPDLLLVDADFVIAGDGAINGLKVTVGEKVFLFKSN